jgi:iron-sulfur cluster assembly protein
VLTLTPTAAEVVRSLAEGSPAPDSGLRISAEEGVAGGVALELALVDEPQALDETVEQAGATVYLDPSAAELLADKQLDATVADEGVTFVLRDEEPDELDLRFHRNGAEPDAH